MVAIRVTLRNLVAILWIVGVLSCDFQTKQSVQISGKLPIHGENRVELLEEWSGKMVTSSRIDNGELNMALDSIHAGVYRLMIYWPRALVSPRERINRIKTGMEERKLEHVLQKYIYIDPASTGRLAVSLDMEMTQETIADYLWRKDPRLILHVRSAGEDSQVFEKAERILNDYRVRHMLERDSLKKILYNSTSDEQQYAEIYQQMNGLWVNKLLPELVEAHKALMNEHPNSVVTPYLIYTNVQDAAEFEPYREIYERMGPKAKRSIYARALHKFINPQ